MECKEAEYYRGILTGAIYKVFESQLKNGSFRRKIMRFNWKTKIWNGFQHNPNFVKIRIETLTHMEKIDKQEVIKLTKYLK